MNRLDTKAQQEKLQYLSYRDALTNLYNRNRYMSVLENYGQNKGQLIRNVGVIYMDLNELKKSMMSRDMKLETLIFEELRSKLLQSFQSIHIALAEMSL